MSTPGSASQTAQQLDPAADVMSESEDDEEAEQEAESSTQSTEIEKFKTMRNKPLTTASAVLDNFKSN